jgi:hypothetical protein
MDHGAGRCEMSCVIRYDAGFAYPVGQIDLPLPKVVHSLPIVVVWEEKDYE